MGLSRTILVVGAASLLAASGRAQQVYLTADTIIGPGQTTIRSTAGGPLVPLQTADLVVQGRVLIINRDDGFTIASLSLETAGGRGATLTHTQGSRIDLTVTGSVSVDANSVINADRMGYAGSAGPGTGESFNGYNGGGAGYGGAGGDGMGSSQVLTTGSGLGGGCYGFDQTGIFRPSAPGSGGGDAWRSGAPVPGTGGAGGGVVRLTIGQGLLLNGRISARGGAGTPTGSGSGDRTGGGGSGGSIQISCASIAGFGYISATGGTSQANWYGQIGGGGGGGGRVSIISASPTLDEIAFPDVHGETGSVRGGPGSVYLRLGGAPRGTVYIDNASATEGEIAEFYGPVVLDANLIVRNRARIGPPHRQSDADSRTFQLTVMGHVEIAADSAITADARGRRGSRGPGQGASSDGLDGGGGGYGGAGSAGGNPGAAGGAVYGDALLPELLLGSGGGNAWAGGAVNPYTGGFGGGCIFVEARGGLLLNGRISAGGGAGQPTGSGSGDRSGGGGSGGSVLILASGITGSGSVSAVGGDSIANWYGYRGGGGGGGRVLIATCSGAAPAVSVVGGKGGAGGRPGSAVLRGFGVLRQPVSVRVCAGGEAEFSVLAAGVGPIGYQWRKDGVAISPAQNPSAATATLVLTNVGAADVAAYRCVVTTGCGTASSDPAALTICAADFNCDGFLDFFDYSDFVGCFETGSCPAGRSADFNDDGFVDFFDYAEFVAGFEHSC